MSEFEVKGYKQNCGWLYSDEVKEHFFSPKNLFKSLEEAKQYEKDADGIGEVGSPACGDVMKMFIKVKDGRITDCKWQTFGCASAIAATSMMSEIVLENGGMTLEEAMEITPQIITERLGGLPKRKIHCSVLGDQALKKAIENYHER